MEKASGVYLTITDNSFLTGGVAEMKVIVPMLTCKGNAGLNRVTANTFKDLVGYDLKYNSNYYGLQKLLENMSYLDVWRLNQGAKVDNAFFMSKASPKAYDDDCESFEEVTHRDPVPLVAVGSKYPGKWQETAVKFLPTRLSDTVGNENPSAAASQTIILDDVSETERTTVGDKVVYGGCLFQNSSGNALVGVIANDMNGRKKVYRVVDNEVAYDEVTYRTTDAWTDGTRWYDRLGNVIAEPSGDASVPMGIGTVRSVEQGFYSKYDGYWYKMEAFTEASVVCSASPEEDADIISALDAADDIQIMFVRHSEVDSVTDNSIGTASWNGPKLTVVLSGQMSRDTFWNILTIPTAITEWTMTVASYANGEYSVQNSYELSTDSASESYWEKVDFGDFNIFLSGAIPSDFSAVREYFLLEGGSNGKDAITAMDIDVSVLDLCKDNILLMNGITDYKVVNRIAGKCQQLRIHCFADVPAYSSYIDAEQWSKRILRGEYVVVAARPDQTENSDGETIYVYPSVNYGCIFAAMMENYGSLCYPPAGPTYGVITADDLLECDYEMYKNELKTNRINWQCLNSLGTMMWEQRTTYSLNTDLSYIAPVFIVDNISDQIVEFERQFNFRYMTRTDLLNQSSGLTAIFESFVTKGFVFAYEINMPTYEEAQRAGRTLRIPMKVMVAKDSEVIELELELTNNL